MDDLQTYPQVNTDLKAAFEECRKRSEEICVPLETEDYSAQPIVDVSPPKWHLAHSTWFFEQFVLVPFAEGYQVYDDDFAFLFNSYYNNIGPRVLRPNRGFMTRPKVSEVYSYRKHVTEAVLGFLETNLSEQVLGIVKLGINHEQQHQELLAYDIKYILGNQALFPSFKTNMKLKAENWNPALIKVEAGVNQIGYRGDGFAFDNELGRHKVYTEAFEISNKLVTNAEFLEFIRADGYENFNYWHAAGWDHIQSNAIIAPLYWHKVNGNWHYYNWDGLVPIEKDLPVMNISFYEAHAFAEWKGMRLPTEQEWEIASDKFQWGQLWEWTGSAYLPYPGFKKAEGALGEYNGKFMVNQMVLRGGSIATPEGHSRNTYRNFFHAQNRWQFNGIRLAR